MRLNKTNLCLLVVLMLLSGNSAAYVNANSGFYLGGDLSVIHYQTPKNAAAFSNFLGFPVGMLRPYVGYRFNDNFALEAAYNNIENSSHHANNGWGPDALRIYSFDFSAKAIAPFESGVSLFAKTGFAVTHQYVYNVVFEGSAPLVNQTSDRVQPLLGAGISYNFTPNLATDLSYTKYFANGPIGDMDMVAVGLTYTFGGSD
jgi:opacity protein-like surface antigen